MIQLRVKTEYTFGEVFAPVERSVKLLKEMGCTAAGIVDKYGTWGHVPWYLACKENGIKPLLGVELVVSDVEDNFQTMWFLAKNAEGLKELYRFTTKAHRQQLSSRRGFLPRLYSVDVLNISENVFVFSGMITNSDFLAAAGAILDLNPSSSILNSKKIEIAKETDLPLVDTSDNYYISEDDLKYFKLLKGSIVKQTPQYIIAPKRDCQFIIDEIEDFELPKAPMIKADGDIEKLCREGIKERGLDWPDEYEERLQRELSIIKEKNFESYFIVVSDMVKYAKKHMLVGPSRGSSAGSLVCYLLQITEVDPIPPKLYFERFIDISRDDLPDIDLDFPDNKRQMVFDYMAEKYGAGKTAHIGTISVYKPRSALIQACKVLGIKQSEVETVKNAMITRSSADARANNCLEDTLVGTEPGKALVAKYPSVIMSCNLEGHASHTGVHAAGLLVCNDDIYNYCSVTYDGIAMISKKAIEKLNLLKIDVLGLRTLSILEDYPGAIDWYRLPLNDKIALDVFNDQKLCAIFQFDGEALRSISTKISYKSIIEIDAVTALARPGPFAGGVTQKYIERMNGAPYSPIHSAVEKYMIETFQLPIYQEQTLAIVKEIGMFDWAETSSIRKAMSKSLGVEFFNKYWEKFKVGAETQGVPEKEAKQIWEMINTMGSWQMNKAHTYSYAIISYWCAYFKGHHPLEFALANLKTEYSEESIIVILRELMQEGYLYEPFDIEKSEVNWSVKDGKLYGGFMNLHGLGAKKAEKIVSKRDAGLLTDDEREDILSKRNPYAMENIFSIETKYGDYYANHDKYDISTPVYRIGDIKEGLPHKTELVFIGRLRKKSPRDANEEANIKKRGGVIDTSGQPYYLDLRLYDDTGNIIARISQRDYHKLNAVEILEKIPEGVVMLIRAIFFNGIRFAFIKKWRVLSEA